MISYPEEIPPFCKIIRNSFMGKDACMECDKNACAAARSLRKTRIYRCHAGLTEAVTPLYVQDMLVGYLLFGHVFSYPSVAEGWQTVREYCEELPIDLAKLEQACKERPLISHAYVHSATHILHAVASYLILEHMATLQEDKLAVQLNAFILAHYTENLTAEKICRQLEVGKTQLYKLSNQMYGCGISTQIRRLRMERAKELLKPRYELTIAEVAAACGYEDYNYFISVFSREVGCTPKSYRNAFLSKTAFPNT